MKIMDSDPLSTPISVSLMEGIDEEDKPPGFGGIEKSSDSEVDKLTEDFEFHERTPDVSEDEQHTDGWNESFQSHYRKKKKHTCNLIQSILITTTILFALVVLILFLVWRLKQCPSKEPLMRNIHMAKNSTAILQNISYNVNSRCFEQIFDITTEFPVEIYLIPCKTLSYSNVSLVNQMSIKYYEASNPLPVVIDERYQNYLTNANINVTVNVSTSSSNPLEPGFIFFCFFTDYSRFQTFKSQSKKSYWKNYSGTECTSKPIGHTNYTILTNEFTHSSPDYVFIGIGSTVDPLDTFQFNFSITGETISNPKGHTLFEVEECRKLSDIYPSCNFHLNITHKSEPLCVVGNRPVDQVSKQPFSNLTAEWPRRKSTNMHEIFIAALSSCCLLFLCCVASLFIISRYLNKKRPFRLCSSTLIAQAT